VAFHTEKKPLKGSGYHAAVHEGIIYLFASKKNRKLFEADSQKYVPACCGFFAYGVAVGKKFVSDADVWRI
jgi:hypothetical protein